MPTSHEWQVGQQRRNLPHRAIRPRRAMLAASAWLLLAVGARAMHTTQSAGIAVIPTDLAARQTPLPCGVNYTDTAKHCP